MKTKVKPVNKSKLRCLPDKFEAGFLRSVDKRSEIYQRLNSSYEAIIFDCGGLDAMTRTKLALAERFVFLEVQIQIWEMQILLDPKKANELCGKWTQACNALTGLAKLIGLKRTTKVATLGEYLGEKGSKAK